MRWLASIAILVCVGCGEGKTAREERFDAPKREGNTPGLALTVCGSVASYQAATAAAEGRMAIDRGLWTIAAGVVVEEQAPLQAGSDVCVEAEMDTSRRILRAVARAPVTPDWPTEE